MTSLLPISDESMFCFHSSHSHNSNYVSKDLVHNLDLLLSCLACTVLKETPSWKFSANPTIFTVQCFLFPKLLLNLPSLFEIFEHFWRWWVKRASFLLMVRFTSWRPFSISLFHVPWAHGPWTEQMLNEAHPSYWYLLADINNCAHFNKRRYLGITKK